MALPPRCVITFLILLYVGNSQSVQFSMDRSPQGSYCGHLQCWADRYFTDPEVLSVVGLNVYDVTQNNRFLKVASLALFDPNVTVDSSKIMVINATGNISEGHAELTLSLKDANDCLNGSFTCELEFINQTVLKQVIQTGVSPKNNGNCPIAFNQIAKVAVETKAHLEETETDLAETKQALKELKLLNTTLNTELAEKTKQVLDLIQQNKSLSAKFEALNTDVTNMFNQLKDRQVTCLKGAPNNIARGKFMLWGEVPALCDTATDGGGWVVIQRRTKGDTDFYKNWATYKTGFGTPDTDFWIGNDNIHSLTSQGYTELRIDIEYNGNPSFARYSSFQVANETSKYRLNVTGYSGTAVDGLTYQNNMQFSTYDRDNDPSIGSCASVWHGAWWYNDCYYSHLNGVWGARDYTGNTWGDPGSGRPPVSFSEMKIRRG